MTLALALSTMCQAQSRKVINLPSWDFSRDGKAWQQVAVPHDWAISGPFDKKWDLQMVAIEQNGEKEKTEKSGRSGALPWIGEGMYKMNLQLPKGYKRAVLVFDGAMSQPIVKVNGKEAGRWAYGYNAFRIDITPYVQFGGKKNLVEVHLNNVEESSRWYPGGGLYRPVSVELYGNENFSTWDTFVRILKADKQEAEVEVNALLEGKTGKSGKTVIALLDEAGKKVAEQIVTGANPEIKTTLKVANPQLWSPESPYLYQVKLTRYEGKKVADVQTLKTGIRTIAVSKDYGFQLNGITRKIKGVCLHHDLGPLGAAENKAALIRQIKMMKQMGCDAIRTAHNMPSTMQMELCDSLGMMVMAESFDMWIYPNIFFSYVPYAENNTSFDAYEVSDPSEQVPTSVKTLVGGTSYDNFDTNPSLMYAYAADKAADVPAIVEGFYGAGRLNHGDIDFVIPDETVVTNGHQQPWPALASLLDSYTSGVVKVFGESNAAGEGGSTGGGETGGSGDGGGTVTPIEGTVLVTFTDSKPSSSIVTVSGNYSTNKGTATIDGTSYSTCVKMESATNISVTVDKKVTMTLYFSSADTKTNAKIDGKKPAEVNAVIDSTAKTMTVTLDAGSHTITKQDTCNLFGIKLVPVKE
jgi:hypothetical protein